MPTITLHTRITAPVEKVFDLARSIDVHMATAAGTKERVVAGRTSGLMELGETVTWKARHLGMTRTMTVKMMEMDRPRAFTDQMVRGPFKSMRHTHTFQADGEATLMTDHFHYTSPLGLLGKLADALFLKGYMTRFLEKRNEGLKMTAGSNEMSTLIEPNST